MPWTLIFFLGLFTTSALAQAPVPSLIQNVAYAEFCGNLPGKLTDIREGENLYALKYDSDATAPEILDRVSERWRRLDPETARVVLARAVALLNQFEGWAAASRGLWATGAGGDEIAFDPNGHGPCYRAVLADNRRLDFGSFRVDYSLHAAWVRLDEVSRAALAFSLAIGETFGAEDVGNNRQLTAYFMSANLHTWTPAQYKLFATPLIRFKK